MSAAQIRALSRMRADQRKHHFYQGDWDALTDSQKASVWMVSLLGGSGIHPKNWFHLSLDRQLKIFRAHADDIACSGARSSWVCKHQTGLRQIFGGIAAIAGAVATFGAVGAAIGGITASAQTAATAIGTDIAAGFAATGVSSVTAQAAAGPVDWGRVARDASIGGLFAGAGSALQVGAAGRAARTGVLAAETEGALAAEARGGVYTLRDEAGAVVRTGRSSDLAAREAAHFNDPVLGEYRFNVEYRTDVYAEQRGLEQMLYDRYPEAQFENGGLNKIRAISPSNPNLPTYMRSAWDFLERMGL